MTRSKARSSSRPTSRARSSISLFQPAELKSIVPRGPKPVGTTALIPEFGGLVGTTRTALLNKPLAEYVKKIEVTVEGGVKWGDKITLPYQPFIGTIGTAPEIEAISSLVPDYYGGNMDLPDIAPDSVIYLPINAPGALLYLGDRHGFRATASCVASRSDIRPSPPCRSIYQGMDDRLAAPRNR